MPFILDFRVQGHSGLQSKFQGSWSYTEKTLSGGGGGVKGSKQASKALCDLVLTVENYLTNTVTGPVKEGWKDFSAQSLVHIPHS